MVISLPFNAKTNEIFSKSQSGKFLFSTEKQRPSVSPLPEAVNAPPPGNSHAHPTCKCIVVLHSSEPIAVCGDNYDLIILTNRVPRPLSFSEFFLSWKNISKEILAHNGIHYKLTSDRYIKLILSSFLFTLSNLKPHFDMYF